MRFTVLPVSGGAFPSQLAELSLLGKKDGITLASSGGNVAAYICLAADYNPYTIERLLRQITSSMFLSNWWPYPLSTVFPSYIPGYTRGSYYGSGIGAGPFFERNFTVKSIEEREIWTGTTCCDNSRSQLFCNRSKETSIIKSKYFRREEYNTMPLKYLDGNIKDISTIALASAAIPSLVPPVKFDKQELIDGGASYSSPLSPMVPILRHYESIHIDYVNSFDVEATNSLCHNNISTLVRTVTSEMIHSMIINDRATGIQLIRSCNGKMRRVEFACCPEFLKCVEHFRLSCDRTMLEIFPCQYFTVELDNYKANDAVKMLWLDRKNFRVRFWYISETVFEDVYQKELSICKDDRCGCTDPRTEPTFRESKV